MSTEEVSRVVVVRKSKFRPAEFRLRPGEIGLSLFRRLPETRPAFDLSAVRASGKQGELGIAEVPLTVLAELGLRLVATPGGTADPQVNRLHVEARFSRWRRLVLLWKRKPVHEAFNETIAPELARVAILLENPSDP